MTCEHDPDTLVACFAPIYRIRIAKIYKNISVINYPKDWENMTPLYFGAYMSESSYFPMFRIYKIGM
jgi:hypothetical protein